MNSRKLAEFCMDQMIAMGIDCIVYCSGARNAPMTKVALDSGLELFDFFHENSAGFFALGLAKQGRRPAVICTSGTAVAQLLSPCSEAFYDDQFILFISADRPKEYRGSGAPQTFNQSGLLSEHCSLNLDISSLDEFPEAQALDYKPMHWNLCFDSPLWWEDKYEQKTKFDQKISLLPKATETIDLSGIDISNSAFVISRLNASEKSQMLEFLGDKAGLKIYLECSSSLARNVFSDKHCVLLSEKILIQAVNDKVIKNIIHIGGVPTTKLWRDLPNNKEVKVTSLGAGSFSGLPGVERFQTKNLFSSLQSLKLSKIVFSPGKFEEENNKHSLELEKLFEKYPLAEASIYNSLSKQIKLSDSVYLSNSMCIRLWDLIKYPDCEYYDYNRGLNGIDGQISSFIGRSVSRKQKRNIGFFGDLTMMYDLSGFWSTRFTEDEDLIFFVMNNSGGKIFDRIFSENPFSNSHNKGFKSIAEFNSLQYSTDLKIPTNGKHLIELLPDEEQNSMFWKDWENLWQ